MKYAINWQGCYWRITLKLDSYSSPTVRPPSTREAAMAAFAKSWRRE